MLAVFHWALAAGDLFYCVALVFQTFALRAIFDSTEPQANVDLDPELWSRVFTILMVACTVLVLIHAVLVAVAGRFLVRWRHYRFCFGVACLNCLSFPFGNILGIFTLIVLLRPSVKRRFDRQPSP